MKIQRGIFQGDAVSRLLFLMAMMPLSHKLKISISGKKLTKLQENINHQMYMDNIKLFAQNEKELETQIQLGYRGGILHKKMCHANNEKQKTANDGRNKTTESRKNQNFRKKKTNLRVFGNIGSGHHQTSGEEGKRFLKKNASAERETYWKLKYVAAISSKS